MPTILNLFRTTSIIEGLSYLVILSVTIGVIDREFVYSLGMAHGVLFMLYLVLSLVASHKQGWSTITWFLLFMASLVPFAFILVEFFIQKELKAQSHEQESKTV